MMECVATDEPSQNEIAVAEVKMPLDALINRHTIKGPDIAKLFRKMEHPSPNTDTPEDADVGTLQEAIEAKQAEVLEAQNDHTASATLSAAVQLMTATRLQNVNTQFDELRDDMNRKKPLQVAPDTFAKADKLRSVAAENFEKWTSAAQMKHSAMSSEVSIADAAIDDAIAALEEQQK